MTTQGVKPRKDSGQADTALVKPLGPIVLRLDPIVELTDDVLLELSSANETLRLERNALGELEILPPTNITSSSQSSDVSTDLKVWARSNGRGAAFESSAGFTLPTGSIRSPDASWVLKSRLTELTEEQKRHGFPPIVPDFVVEVRTTSDTLAGAQRKMEEYMENGVTLGWLIDSVDPVRRVYVYRPGVETEVLEAPDSLSGEPELPGFVLELQPIWEPGF